MFVGTDSWNTDFIFWNASFLKFSFEKFQMMKVQRDPLMLRLGENSTMIVGEYF